MNYYRRIIVDLDDTISRTLNRDWKNAEPIMDVITKINKLYDDGWEVFIVTARGQLSCNGDYKLADKKYRKIVEKWLLKNNVKYHKLSFMKELGAYYIDDKALLPNEFVDLDIRMLKKGWSGAIVEKRGNKVYKTGKTSLNEAAWYNMAKLFIDVPKVYSVIGDTLCMEYIKHDETNQMPTIFKIMNIIKTMKSIPMNSYFKTYINRICERHLKIIDIKEFYDIIPMMNEHKEVYNNNSSFCHGDLTIENVIINSENNHVLIDPIFEMGQYMSWMLDVSKLIHSYRKHNMHFMVEFIYNEYSEFKKELMVLEITQWIRIIKYVKKFNKNLANEYIELIKELIIKYKEENCVKIT